MQAQQAAAAEGREELSALERQLSVGDILSCRQTAQRVLDASLASASGMGPAMAGAPPPAGARNGKASASPAQQQKQQPAGMPLLAKQPSLPQSSAGSSGSSGPSAAASAPVGGSLVSSDGASTAVSGGRRLGYLAWGASKAAGLLRYLPYAASAEVGGVHRLAQAGRWEIVS